MASTTVVGGIFGNESLSSKGEEIPGARISRKRMLQPPGGGCNDIFGGENGSPVVSPNNSTNNGNSTPLSENGHSPAEMSGRRKSDSTQDRLFGHADEGATPRRVVDRMKSSIFSDDVDSPSKTPSSSKKYVRRNPITGAVTEEYVGSPGQNGHTNGQDSGSSNGTPTGMRVRNPPGGRSSGIF